MKLVDILAREMKAWPEECRWIEFDGANGCYADMGQDYITLITDCSECTERTGAAVHKDEWQSVVDSLKVREGVADADAGNLISLDDVKAKWTRTWTGEGLPPVGAVCEWRDKYGGAWIETKIMYLSKHTALLLYRGDDECPDCEAAFSPDDCEFRPIRTPEQIAAEIRSKAVDDMIAALGMDNVRTSEYIRCGLLYDAGYRKFEITEE
jgi:hypothetical protein